MGYREDQDWETSWLPEVYRNIKSSILLRQSTKEEDMTSVSDVSLTVRSTGGHPFSIGVRIRRPHYFENEQYRGEVTLRAHRDSGAVTEWAKVMSGKGTLFFYGFANPGWKCIRCLRRWTLFSLPAVRRIVKKHNPQLPLLPNGDGTYFHPISVSEWAKLDSKFVVDANWGPWSK